MTREVSVQLLETPDAATRAIYVSLFYLLVRETLPMKPAFIYGFY
jgi:hypothetical protein